MLPFQRASRQSANLCACLWLISCGDPPHTPSAATSGSESTPPQMAGVPRVVEEPMPPVDSVIASPVEAPVTEPALTLSPASPNEVVFAIAAGCVRIGTEVSCIVEPTIADGPRWLAARALPSFVRTLPAHPHAPPRTDGSTDTLHVLSNDAVQVVMGKWHVCVLTSTGSVQCAGHGGFGQLGHGDRDDRGQLSTIDELQATQLCAGSTHTCALRPDQTVVCFGQNDMGQFGEGTGSLVPVAVPSLTQVIELACAGDHTCVRTTDGTVHCTGSNLHGELGIPRRETQQGFRASFAPLAQAENIVLGPHATCLHDSSSRRLRCVGANPSGGSYRSVTTPSEEQRTVFSFGRKCSVIGNALRCVGPIGPLLTLPRGTTIDSFGLSDNQTCALTHSATAQEFWCATRNSPAPTTPYLQVPTPSAPSLTQE